MSASTGSDRGTAQASIAVDPHDGPLVEGDDVQLSVGYNLVNLVFKGIVAEDSETLAPWWAEASLKGNLYRASRKTNIVDPVASGIPTDGIPLESGGGPP